jgi:histone H3/H4
MGDLPNAVLKRLITKHGGGLRVSGTALERAAVAAAEDYIARLAREAQSSAEDSRRKTIMEDDIEKARSKLASSV